MSQIQKDRLNLEEQNKSLHEEALKLRRKVDLLTNTISKVKLSEQKKSEFLAHMCHEIRSPLGNIINMINLFKIYFYETGEGIDIHKCFDIIDISSARLSKTLDSILHLSAIENDSYLARFETINFSREIVIPILKEMDYSASSKGLKLEFEDESGDCYVKADKYSLSQIIVNLIDNALKYTQAGGVEIRTRVIGPFLLAEVADTGAGIKKESIESLFNPYFRGNNDSSSVDSGYGLGLALVKEYCKINNIKISVESEEGKGTRFILTIPLP